MISKRLLIFCFTLVFAFQSTLLAQTEKSESSKKSSPESKSSSKDSNASFDEAYVRVEQVNGGQQLPDGINLSTPQACLEHFVLSSRKGDFKQAAHALDLSLLPKAEQQEQGKLLARKLDYLLNKKIWLDWNSLPDRTDGQVDQSIGQSPLAGVPRRSIRFGVIDLEDRPIEMRVRRVKAEGKQPVWLISPHTVENIPALYQMYGPSFIESNLPDWLRTIVWSNLALWELIGVVIAIGVGVACSWFAGRLTHWIIRSGNDDAWHWVLAEKMQRPSSLFAGFFIVYVLVATFLSGPILKILQPLLLIMVVGSLAWMGTTLLNYIFEHVVETRLQNGDEDKAEAKQLLTQLSVARRLISFAIFLAGFGIILMQLNLFEWVGLSLLASAGILSVVVGVAAQNVLGNILAGLQIAFTRPVRIGDSVQFEGEWGYVEDITFTYLTIRTWDKRRLIVPLQYLISRPIENWTKTSSHLIKPIFLHVDYTADVDAIREFFSEILQENELWDEKTEPNVIVYELKEETMQLRALCSAKNPSDAWTLHCELREQLIGFIRSQSAGEFLPRRRLLVDELAENGAISHATSDHRDD